MLSKTRGTEDVFGTATVTATLSGPARAAFDVTVSATPAAPAEGRAGQRRSTPLLAVAEQGRCGPAAIFEAQIASRAVFGHDVGACQDGGERERA